MKIIMNFQKKEGEIKMFETVYMHIHLFLFKSTIDEKMAYINVFEISAIDFLQSDKGCGIVIECKNGKEHLIRYKTLKEALDIIGEVLPDKQK